MAFETLEQGMATQKALLEPQHLSVIDLIVDGGAVSMGIVGVLFILLFLTLYIYFERVFALKAAATMDRDFMDQVCGYVCNGKWDIAQLLCAQTNSPVARLTEKAMAHSGKPTDELHTTLENTGTLEVYKLEKNVSLLATIAGAAPMLGFLGTVIGMILAFHAMAIRGGQAEMGALASGIYTAMTTTVAGLLVGIIAYMGYNHLVYKTDKVIHNMQAQAIAFVELLHKPS